MRSPEALEVVEISKPPPGPKQARVKSKYRGSTTSTCIFVLGLYKADLPFIPGSEAAGVVEAVGRT
jgi:NADPH2:quinone reductase